MLTVSISVFHLRFSIYNPSRRKHKRLSFEAHHEDGKVMECTSILLLFRSSLS